MVEQRFSIVHPVFLLPYVTSQEERCYEELYIRASRPQNYAMHILEHAPGIQITDDLRELSYLRPREVSIVRYDPLFDKQSRIADLLYESGQNLRAVVAVERTKISSSSGGWLHRILQVRYV